MAARQVPETVCIDPKTIDPNHELKVEAEKVALKTATKMLENNSTPSTQLQVDIIKAATELLKIARC